MKKLVPIELLAPAKNAEFGIAAINHGADAVYIGASRFGARAAAANSIEEIEKLINYSHFYKAKVYAVINTIIYDTEIKEVSELIQTLYNVGIDGLILQDMGILELDLPPIQLIASTQTHNISAEKVLFLEKAGFQRVILARELDLNTIKNIRAQTTVQLEFFVHGALCVSFSGQCYMSQAVCNRSGNRGVCSQPCRSSYDLVDQQGNVVVKDKHLLSLKDLNLSSYISDLLEAGITSFKIEGRLKDLSYVKNITGNYRQILDNLLSGNSLFVKSSSGKTIFSFAPDPAKTFNRTFTSYNLLGRTEKTGTFSTQKSLGKEAAYVTEIGKNWIRINGEALVNGDGICYFDLNGNLSGTLVNKVEENRIYLNDLGQIREGTILYRNHDHQFEKNLQRDNTSERKIKVNFRLKEEYKGFTLCAEDEDNNLSEIYLELTKQRAEQADISEKQIRTQLSKLGNTGFMVEYIQIDTSIPYFFSAATINQMRREVIEKLSSTRIASNKPVLFNRQLNNIPFPNRELTFTGNVSNSLARKFYERHGVEKIEHGFEFQTDYGYKTIMTTKHCIRYQLDACEVHQKTGKKLPKQLYLKDKQHVYRLEFDCKECIMKVVFEK